MFAALLLPDFHLQAALRFREALWERAVAVLQSDQNPDGHTRASPANRGHRGGGRVLECTISATRMGVTPGQLSTQALARCGDLMLLPRALEVENTLGALLCEMARMHTPTFELTRISLATLDLRRARLKEDWNTWCILVRTQFAAQQLRVRIGVAPYADAALFAAHYAPHETPPPASLNDSHAGFLVVQDAAHFLSSLAVADLAPPPELVALLHSWGIRTLGELLHLPRAELIARLGREAGQMCDRAANKTERLLRLEREQERFEESFEFEHQVESLEPLLFLLKRFLDALCLRLRAAARVAASMRLLLPLEDGSAYERHFRIPEPVADPAVLLRILETHLDALRLEQRPVGIHLSVAPALPGQRQLQLFENPLRDPNRFGETLARLSAMVGESHIGTPGITHDHHPKRVTLHAPDFIHASAQALAASGAASADASIRADAHILLEKLPNPVQPGFPLRHYRPALPAHVRVEHQRPIYVVSEQAHGSITSALGPYRLSGEWWEPAPWRHEEWDIELSNGVCYRLSSQASGWFVEGTYG